MKRLAVMSAAILSFVALTAVASAQYPPPEDVVVVSVGNPTPSTNSTVTITWSIENAQSALRPGGGTLRQGLLTISLQVPSTAVCRPEIASQPGTGASVKTISETVDANGRSTGTAELYTGRTPGPIVVRVSCQSGATADITVMVQGAQPSTPSTSGSQASGSTTPLPPKTGSFGGGEEDSSKAILLSALGLLAVSSVVLGGRLLTRKR